MTYDPNRTAAMARRAVQSRDWATVTACAREIVVREPGSAEGHFLGGLAEKAAQRPLKAAEAFARALEQDAGRYDAAIELANQYSIARRNAEAAALLGRYEGMLGNSPRYLDLAGTVYTDIGLPEKAWPLYVKASELQPGVPFLQGNLAACAVFVGRIKEARAIYQTLLAQRPDHQHNHYYLSRLGRASDAAHVDQMKRVLAETKLPPERNVFLYYAIGKELEDLGEWQEAFHYYRMAGDAVTSVAAYDVAADIGLIDRVIEVCHSDWIKDGAGGPADAVGSKTPIFVVGLPRTGSTLTERILASHSQVQSLGETLFMQMVLRSVSGVETVEKMTPEIIAEAAQKNIAQIASGYLDAVQYRLDDRSMFIDKLPINFLYLGFIAKAYPDARIVHLRRHPMDACFAMYKQVFTWAYKFSYTLEGLGRYYLAYERLRDHWRRILGERFIEVEYESLVADQEGQTRAMLEKLGLDFEQACLDFHRNESASTTASSVQVREKIHTRSVQRWKHFEQELQPLRDILEGGGIVIG